MEPLLTVVMERKKNGGYSTIKVELGWHLGSPSAFSPEVSLLAIQGMNDEDWGRRTLWKSKGEDQDEAKKEFIESLKVLGGELGQKRYFGGESGEWNK